MTAPMTGPAAPNAYVAERGASGDGHAREADMAGRTPGQLWEREAERDARTGLRSPAWETLEILAGMKPVRGPLVMQWLEDHQGERTPRLLHAAARGGVIREGRRVK